MKLPSSTISVATVLTAIDELNNQGIETPTAQQLSELTLRPKGYDMGGRLFNLSKSSNPFINKIDGDHFNTYSLTDKGREYLSLNRHKAQVYGEYDNLSQEAVSTKPSDLALQAANEIQEIIALHTTLRTQLKRFYQTAILLEKELDE